jgi:hypothetical protein
LKGRARGRNFEEWMMVEKEIYEIGRMGRLRKQNEDGVNSLAVEARIGDGRGRLGIGPWKVGESCKRSTKVEPGGIQSKNKTVDAKVTECSERSEKLEEAKRGSIGSENG